MKRELTAPGKCTLLIDQTCYYLSELECPSEDMNCRSVLLTCLTRAFVTRNSIAVAAMMSVQAVFHSLVSSPRALSTNAVLQYVSSWCGVVMGMFARREMCC